MYSIPRRYLKPTVVILGGGPSVKSVCIHSILKDSIIGKASYSLIVINNGGYHFPLADVLVSVDGRWIEANVDLLRKRYALGRKNWLALPSAAGGYTDYLQSDVVERCTEVGLSKDSHMVHVRGNSGYAAINFATLAGAKRIYLLGYDMQDMQSHWHAPYAWKSGVSPCTVENWAEEFNTMCVDLEQLQVEVLNVGMDSRITAFPKLALTQDWRPNVLDV